MDHSLGSFTGSVLLLLVAVRSVSGCASHPPYFKRESKLAKSNTSDPMNNNFTWYFLKSIAVFKPTAM